MKAQERKWYKVWPSHVPKVFEADKPLSEYMREISAKVPNRVAVSFYGREITYEQLNEMIDRFAWGLVMIGVKKGDRVALYMPNCPQFIVSFIGILRAGGAAVSLNPMFRHAEIEYELVDSMAETLVSADYLYPEVEKVRDRVPLKNVILTSLGDYLPEEPVLPLPPEAQAPRSSFSGTLDLRELLKASQGNRICEVSDLKEDLALLQYTGGTTGLPKGAMITHYSLAFASVGANYWYRTTEDDVFLGVTPFFHIMGMVQMMCAPLISGGHVVVLTRFFPDVVARAIAYHKCTAWVGTTTMLTGLLQLPEIEQYDLSSLRYICTGGSPMTAEIQGKVKSLSPKAALVDGYGLTESVSQGGAVTPLGRYKSGFIGVPHLNDIKVVDLQSGQKEVPPNREGEIVIKGPALMKGYWQKPGETAKVLKDGWLHTGDIGLMDEEGYVKFLGRSKELIKCSGYSVFPPEVEELLHRHPAVADAGIIGIPDPYRGESPKAFIVLKPEYEGKIKEAEVIDWCKENMAAYKRPRVVEFRKEIPKSAAGKILRRLLSEEG